MISLWQCNFLPRSAYGWTFAETLLLLHSQPPAVNTLAFLVYLLDDLTSLGEAVLLRLLQLVLVTVTIFSWTAVIRHLGLGRRYQVAFWLLLMSHPMTLFFFDHLNHTSLAPPTTGLFVLAGWRYFNKPSGRTAAWFSASVLLLIMTRAVWHPPFALAVLALAYLHGRSSGAGRLSILKGLAAPMTVAVLWLLKNFLLFGVIGMSSWTSWNLGGRMLPDFFRDHKPDWGIVEDYYAEKPRLRAWFASAPATGILTLVPPEQTLGGGGNGNHYAVPALGSADMKALLSDYRQNPAKYIDRVIWNLYYFNLAALESPYAYDFQSGRSTNLNEPTPRNIYARLHSILYQGTWLGDIVVVRGSRAVFRPSILPYLLPVLFLGAMVAGYRVRNLARAHASMLMVLGWSGFSYISTVIIVDGGESARMRWEVEPIAWVCVMAMVATWRQVRSAKSGLTRPQDSVSVQPEAA